MKTLLKDMPMHAERIENNYCLKQDIEDLLSGNGIDLDDLPVILDGIMELSTEFVNQNYTFKGI